MFEIFLLERIQFPKENCRMMKNIYAGRFLAALICIAVALPSLAAAAPARPGESAAPRQADQAAGEEGDWTITTLAAHGGSYASLAAGPDGAPHIAYLKTLPEPGLYHTTLAGKKWVTTPVDLVSTVQTTSIAVAGDGAVHIAYHDNRSRTLKRAYSTGEGWEIETVDSSPGTGLISSIQLSRSGQPRIFYWDSNRQAFRYAALFQTGWSIRTAVDLSCDVNTASGTSLVLDPAGEPHATLANCETSSLDYAYRDGSTWKTAVIDTGSYGFGSHSLVIDKSGQLRAGYRSRSVRYAWQVASGWENEVVDETQVFAIADTSLALDSGGRPQMAYRLETAEGEEQLLHAYFDRGEWHKQLVDEAVEGSFLRFVRILVDSRGNPHIVYWDVEANDLKYATMNLSIGGGPRYLPLIQKSP
jgi:hypothetical protein